MRQLTNILKVIAIIPGLAFFLFGLVFGVFGIGPDGPHHSIPARIFGIYVIILGILYLMPNKYKLETRIPNYFFLLFETAPFFILLSFSPPIIKSASIQFSMGFFIIAFLSLASPLSIFLANRMRASTNSGQ